jgi:hypothetical protein
MRHQSSHSHVDTATNGKLVEECGEIVADRSLADAHPLCDFLVKPAECSVPQHFTLAGGELVYYREPPRSGTRGNTELRTNMLEPMQNSTPIVQSPRCSLVPSSG